MIYLPIASLSAQANAGITPACSFMTAPKNLYPIITFTNSPDLLPSKLSILRNDVSVLKARLPGKRPNGGAVECLLLRPGDPPETTWRCLLKPGSKTAKAGIFSNRWRVSGSGFGKSAIGEYLVRFDLQGQRCPFARPANGLTPSASLCPATITPPMMALPNRLCKGYEPDCRSRSHSWFTFYPRIARKIASRWPQPSRSHSVRRSWNIPSNRDGAG